MYRQRGARSLAKRIYVLKTWGPRRKYKEWTHNKSYENLTHTQLFIKNEAFPTEVSNNRYKWLPVTQGKSLKEQGKKQPTHWPISASSTEQLEEISLKYTTLHLQLVNTKQASLLLTWLPMFRYYPNIPRIPKVHCQSFTTFLYKGYNQLSTNAYCDFSTVSVTFPDIMLTAFNFQTFWCLVKIVWTAT